MVSTAVSFKVSALNMSDPRDSSPLKPVDAVALACQLLIDVKLAGQILNFHQYARGKKYLVFGAFTVNFQQLYLPQSIWASGCRCN